MFLLTSARLDYHRVMEAFRIEHADVRRDGKYILSDISIEAEIGERIAIIGPNGAGKSTLVDVIDRRVYPLATDRYRSSLFGEERWIVSELRMKIGHVSPGQDEFFRTTYTAREIVASGLHASLGFDFHHTIDPSDWERADEELDKVSMLGKKDRTMNTLSTGEMRRVLLARAAVTSPSVLLLDEASAGLDFPSRADLRSTISGYATERRTLVMVTHELSEILPSIQRIILMKDGRIVKDGSKEECLTEPVLSELFGRSVHVAASDGIYTAFC